MRCFSTHVLPGSPPLEDGLRSSKRRRLTSTHMVTTRPLSSDNQLLNSGSFRVLDAAGLLQGTLFGTAQSCLAQVLNDLESGVFRTTPVKLLMISSIVANLLRSNSVSADLSLCMVDSILTSAFRTPPIQKQSANLHGAQSSTNGHFHPALSGRFFDAVHEKYVHRREITSEKTLCTSSW